MSLAEWMKLIEESAEHLSDEVYEHPEHSRTTPETKTYTIEWRYAENAPSSNNQDKP